MVLVVTILAGAVVAGSCQQKTGSTTALPTTTKPGDADEPAVAGDDAAIEQHIGTFCGNCHRVPQPDYFPRAAWHDEVERGYGFYLESGRRVRPRWRELEDAG